MKITLAVAAALAVLLTGCGSDDSEPETDETASATASETDASEAPLISCDLFQEGATITAEMEAATETGCAGEDGNINLSTYAVAECADGRALLEHADVLFGFPGEDWQAGDVNSSEYAAALAECEGETEEGAPETIEVDCPEGLEDGTYTLQPNGKYTFSDGNDFEFTLAEIEGMNASYGCEVVG